MFNPNGKSSFSSRLQLATCALYLALGVTAPTLSACEGEGYTPSESDESALGSSAEALSWNDLLSPQLNPKAEGPELAPNFAAAFQRLRHTQPQRFEIEGTYGAGAGAVGGHVQGLGWGLGPRGGSVWAITHSTNEVAPARSLLVLCRDPSTRSGDGLGCFRHRIGNDRHGGGGTQIVGEVLVTADEGGNPMLYDVSQPGWPRALPCSFPPGAPGGAGALAWDPAEGVHVAIFESGNADQIYVSNGQPLGSQSCSFSQAALGGYSSLWPPSEGLSQLYYDPVGDSAGRHLVSIGGYESQGQQWLSYQYFELVETSPDQWKLSGKGAKIEVPLAGSSSQFGPSFRWGGTVRMYRDHFDVVLAPLRMHDNGAGHRNMLIHVYSP